MKVIKEERFGRRPVVEDAYTKPFHLEFTVDGVKSTQNVNAVNLQSAKELVKKQYAGKNILFQKASEDTSSKKENVNEQALFDDDTSDIDEFLKEDDEISYEVDDEFGEFDIEKFGNSDAHEEVAPAPKVGPSAGISSVINALIIDEIEAIEGYNSAIIAAKECGLEQIADVLTGIQNEENKHVGELQECLKTLTPSADKIDDGANEARKEMAGADEEVSVSFPVDDEF